MKTRAFRLLCFGDVVGEKSCFFLHKVLPELRKREGADLVIANGENSARRGGIDPESAELLYAAGVDLITTGNHVFRQRSVYDLLDGADSLLRPCNYPATCPGKGYTLLNLSGLKILVINVMGTLFMESLTSPFEAVERILEREEGHYDFALCDFHGEATGEKKAFASYFDSRISAVFGTHTHIPTADLGILPGGTGYITDLGMVGGADSVLGMKKEIAIAKFTTHMPTYYEVAEGKTEAWGAVFDIDPDTGLCVGTRQIHLTEE
ncbi:MAG: YmdB family metallophosphoesterase [Clostridia bacterium]|nr:YmdB family metallophosphoesterase [Clostridia bacterium]